MNYKLNTFYVLAHPFVLWPNSFAARDEYVVASKGWLHQNPPNGYKSVAIVLPGSILMIIEKGEIFEGTYQVIAGEFFGWIHINPELRYPLVEVLNEL